MQILFSTRLFSPSRLIALFAIFAFAGCSNEIPLEKAILGTWVQDTPVSMSAENLQTTTSDTVLTLKKNGEGRLSRVLNLQGATLPPEGISLNIDLQGQWRLQEGQLVQTAETASITPRTTDALTLKWADQLQAQADRAEPSIKTIVAADKKQLILQDIQTGTTDVYRRK